MSRPRFLAQLCGAEREQKRPVVVGQLARRQKPAIVKKLPGRLYEEVLASLIGSVLVNDPADAATLVEKAAAELAILGVSAAATAQTIARLLALLRRVL